MSARLGTTLSTLLARFRRPRGRAEGGQVREPKMTPVISGGCDFLLPRDVSTDLMHEYDKRIAELLADEREHSLALGPADGDPCYALSDVVSGSPCTLSAGHRVGHVWATGGGQ